MTPSKKITVLSLNIDSLNSKFDELNILIHTLAESNVFISVICIQEARIGEHSNVEHFNLKNYKMITQAYTDRCSRKGGLVTYILNSISFVSQTMHNTYSTWEGLFVDMILVKISQSVTYTDPPGIIIIMFLLTHFC